MKIVINSCYGGFGLSEEALKLYNERAETKIEWDWDIPRNDPILVQVVEELGKEANDMCAYLEVIEIPDDVNWYIEEYDGLEHIAEVHRTWR